MADEEVVELPVEAEEAGSPLEAQPPETVQDEPQMEVPTEAPTEIAEPSEPPSAAPVEEVKEEPVEVVTETQEPPAGDQPTESVPSDQPTEPPAGDQPSEIPPETSEELHRPPSEKAITFEAGQEEPVKHVPSQGSKGDTGSMMKVRKASSEVPTTGASAVRLSKQQSDAIGKGILSSATSIGKKMSTVRASQIEIARRRSERLGSKARQVLGSVLSIRRLSAVGEYYDKKSARYMNTYKLESEKPFNPEKVEKILELIMTEALEGLTYDPVKCPKQAKWASSAIRAKLKEQEFDRYKLICLVSIGEKNSQDVLVTCRFLWDAEKDRYATFALENSHVYGIAQCFGLYYE